MTHWSISTHTHTGTHNRCYVLAAAVAALQRFRDVLLYRGCVSAVPRVEPDGLFDEQVRFAIRDSWIGQWTKPKPGKEILMHGAGRGFRANGSCQST